MTIKATRLLQSSHALMWSGNATERPRFDVESTATTHDSSSLLTGRTATEHAYLTIHCRTATEHAHLSGGTATEHAPGVPQESPKHCYRACYTAE